MPRFPLQAGHGDMATRRWAGIGPWSPDPPGAGWPGARRIARVTFAMFVIFLLLPLAFGVAVAAGFAGWVGVAVIVVICLALLITGVLFSRFAFRSFRSVNELVTSTGRLSEGDYSVRMSSNPSAAFRPAAQSFNRMAERLETSDDLRRRLLADVGHELRTPLTIIRGELEAMADGVRDLNKSEIRLLLGDISAMERLLDDLKTLSTTEAGVLNLDREPTDLVDFVDEVARRFTSEAGARGVELTASPNGGPESIIAEIDRYRIGEVMSNLIINALRAVSTGGRIDVRVRRGRIGDQPGAIIEVTDDGVGIPAEQFDLVFDRFHKGADSNGSGLGLTISRDLVHAHGGTIAVSSDVGAGTSFTVSLPLG